jgi:hypothetical protein
MQDHESRCTGDPSQDPDELVYEGPVPKDTTEGTEEDNHAGKP